MSEDFEAPAPSLEPLIEVTQEDMNKWFVLTTQLAKLKEDEMALRLKIAKGRFKDPKEGTNKSPLSDGYFLELQHVINRKVREDILTVSLPALRKAKLPMDELIKYKPEVSITEYRKLNEAQRALFDAVLEIKPGSPQLKIVKPKRGA